MTREPEDVSDTQLRRRALAGGRDAEDVPRLLLERWRIPASRIGRGVLGRRPQEIDEAFVEGSLDALRKLHAVPEGVRTRAWAMGIFRIACLRVRERRPAAATEPEQDRPCEAAGPATEIRKRERSDRLHAAIAALPDEERAVVEHRHLHELEFAAIAQTIGITERTVYNRLGRAFAMLRAAIGDSFDLVP